MCASLALSPKPEASRLLEYPIPSTLMSEVVELVACPTFLHVELGSLIRLSRDWVRVTHVTITCDKVRVTHMIVT